MSGRWNVDKSCVEGATYRCQCDSLAEWCIYRKWQGRRFLWFRWHSGCDSWCPGTKSRSIHQQLCWQRARKTRSERTKNLQNFLLSFAELFLLPQLLDGEGDVGNPLLETIIGLLLKLWGGFLRLIDDPRRLANNSVSKLLLVARDARLQLVVIRPVLVAELRVLSQGVMVESPLRWLMRHFAAAGTLEEKNSSTLCLIDAKSFKNLERSLLWKPVDI